jgi:hypothetical protein
MRQSSSNQAKPMMAAEYVGIVTATDPPPEGEGGDARPPQRGGMESPKAIPARNARATRGLGV